MIQVDGLTKYYGAHAAIRDLHFNIERGEVIGFLGLNGAGKSTTLRVLGCVLLPTAGQVTIDGFDVVRDPHEIRKKIGFLPDTPPLYNEMTVAGYLRFVAELRGVSSKDAAKRVAEVEEKTAIGDVSDAPISTLSHGFRQRVGVAQALVHNPSLLILDEPTSGLDPVQIVEMRQLIRSLRGAHTILLSSHILSEISQTCDRLLVIQAGEIVAQGSEAQLSAQIQAAAAGGEEVIEIQVKGAAEKARTAAMSVEGMIAAEVVRDADGLVSMRCRASSDVRPKLVRALVAADLDLLHLHKGASQQLENIFLKLTQNKDISA
jgi:gliding motility-associated transport system ATP-binding protein